MVIFKSGIAKKERGKIITLLNEIRDDYSDFYVTKNNQRIFLTENTKLLFKLLKYGEKIAYEHKGFLLTVGFSDKSKRKYLKCLCQDNRMADRLIKVTLWNLGEYFDLWIKLKKRNPLIRTFLRNGWEFFGGRGKEILLVRRKKYDRFNKTQNQKSNRG